MADRKASKRPAKRSETSFSSEELSAMKERVREQKARRSGAKGDGESDILAKIAEMSPADRRKAERVHAIVRANAPMLTMRTWYGMPAYSKDDQVVLFFRAAAKFKTRYATLGFSDEATLDEGGMWATDFAIMDLSEAEEARITALVRKAVGAGTKP